MKYLSEKDHIALQIQSSMQRVWRYPTVKEIQRDKSAQKAREYLSKRFGMLGDELGIWIDV